MIASVKPRSSMTSASSVYMTPMRLWSTLVIHSRQRYGRWPARTTQEITPSRASPTRPDAAIGIGWSSGTASQLSLPSMSASGARRNGWCRFADLRAGCGRDRLGDDLLEKVGIDVTVSRRGDVQTLLGECNVALVVERGGRVPCISDPAVECLRAHRPHLEVHSRKAVPTELRRESVENPLSVSLKMQLGRHAVHRVDHAAELRDKERVHDAGGAHPEIDGGPYRNDELVDARDALVGVDEQPLPVERDDLHVERLGLPVERLGRTRSCDPIQAMPPRNMMTSKGTDQTTSSMRPE